MKNYKIRQYFSTLYILAFFAVTAHLSAAIITVDTLVDDNATVNYNCSLREAILSANADISVDGCVAGLNMDTINFSVSGSLNLIEVLPRITDDLEIIGPGTSELRISQVSGSVYAGIFAFKGSSSSAVGSQVKRFMVKGLSIDYSVSVIPSYDYNGIHLKRHGGAISLMDWYEFTMDHVNISYCQSLNDTGGGAIFATGYAAPNSKLNILWSNISANLSSSNGGGLHIGRSVDVLIKNSSISGNLAKNGSSGGGIFMKSDSEYGTSLVIESSSIIGNLAGGHYGGGLAIFSETITGILSPINVEIYNSTIVDNVAHHHSLQPPSYPVLCSVEGAGIYLSKVTSLHLENSIVHSNKDGDFLAGTLCSDSDIYIPIVDTPILTTGSTNWLGILSVSSTFFSGLPNVNGDYVNAGSPDLVSGSGGPTYTLSPSSTSPLIDIRQSDDCTDIDQRGFKRTVDVTGKENCDIGAVEFNSYAIYDYDEDSIVDENDNCPLVKNPDQEDDNGYKDKIGAGDACENIPIDPPTSPTAIVPILMYLLN